VSLIKIIRKYIKSKGFMKKMMRSKLIRKRRKLRQTRKLLKEVKR